MKDVCDLYRMYTVVNYNGSICSITLYAVPKEPNALPFIHSLQMLVEYQSNRLIIFKLAPLTMFRLLRIIHPNLTFKAT